MPLILGGIEAALQTLDPPPIQSTEVDGWIGCPPASSDVK